MRCGVQALFQMPDILPIACLCGGAWRVRLIGDITLAMELDALIKLTVRHHNRIG